MMGGWMLEVYEHEVHGYAIKERVFAAQTPFQSVEIVETLDFGRALIIDGIPQSSELDEFIYHEIMVHPALCAHPDPKSVLVIGGGEGATLREVCKHNIVDEVVMVDIDPDMIAICKEHLASWHQGAFDDPRVQMIYGDGREFLQNKSRQFDVIILDLVDPFEDSPANKLYTLEFYALVVKSLSGNGVMALQALSAGLHHDEEHIRLIRTLRQAFDKVFPCYAFIPVFSTLYGFAVCGGEGLGDQQLMSDEVDTILENRGVTGLRFYDSQVAHSIFTVPRHMQTRLTDESFTIWTDSTISNK